MLVLALASLFALSQTDNLIHPGDAALDGSFLKPYVNRWRISLQKPGGAAEVVGDWTDRLETARYHGEAVLTRTQVESYKDPAQPGTTYVNYFDPKTLRPILSQLTSTSGAGWVREYNTDGLTMYVSRPDKSKQEIKAPVSQATFDFFGGMYGLLVAALPMAKGYKATLPTFRYKPGASDNLALVRLAVESEQAITLPDGSIRRTWVVKGESPAGEMTFWVCKQAPYVIRLQMKEPDPDGGDDHWTWDMVKPAS